MELVPSMDVIFSDHAISRLKRRNIAKELVHEIIARHPEKFETQDKRILIQDKISLTDPDGDYLLRIFIDIDRTPAEIVTVYFTSKIDKYIGRE